MTRRLSGADAAIIAGLSVAAFFARLYHVNQGLWYDEIYSLLNYIRLPFSEMLSTMNLPNNHLLANALSRISIEIFGEHEWSLRLPSVVIGTLAVPLVYAAARELFSMRVAVVSGLLFCFSKWPLWFSQEARGYAGMIFCALASQLLFIRLLEEFKPGRAALYFIASFAGIYFHLYTAFVIAAQAVVFIGLKLSGHGRAGWKPFYMIAAVTVAAVIAYVPVLGSMLEFLDKGARVSAGRSLDADFFIQWMEQWGAGEGRLAGSCALLALFLAGAGFEFYRRPFTASLFLLPGLLLLVATKIFGLYIYIRFLAFLLPFYFIFMASGMEFISRAAGYRRAALAILAVLAAVVIMPSTLEYYRLGKQGFREAAAWIRENEPRTRVYSMGLAAGEFAYYFPQAAPVPMGRDMDPEKTRQALVATSHPWSWGQNNAVFLKNHCRALKTWQSAGYRENQVFVFDCREP